MRDITISLLHASYRRPGGPDAVIDAWLARATRPALVEYVLAMDKDESACLSEDVRGRVKLVVNEPDQEWSTAVRNWNAAAVAASGDLLVVIADDLFPTSEWDEELRALCAGLNPNRLSFAVKLGDAPAPADTLMRHPVVSRAFYEELGLFDGDFHGVFCDRDITTRAFWKSFIIDGRSLKLDHRHPSLLAGANDSISHIRGNRLVEYRFGQRVYHQRWGWARRNVPVRLLASESIVTLKQRGLDRYLAHIRRQALVGLTRASGRRWTRRLTHPCRTAHSVATLISGRLRTFRSST